MLECGGGFGIFTLFLFEYLLAGLLNGLWMDDEITIQSMKGPYVSIPFTTYEIMVTPHFSFVWF